MGQSNEECNKPWTVFFVGIGTGFCTWATCNNKGDAEVPLSLPRRLAEKFLQFVKRRVREEKSGTTSAICFNPLFEFQKGRPADLQFTLIVGKLSLTNKSDDICLI